MCPMPADHVKDEDMQSFPMVCRTHREVWLSGLLIDTHLLLVLAEIPVTQHAISDNFVTTAVFINHDVVDAYVSVQNSSLIPRIFVSCS